MTQLLVIKDRIRDIYRRYYRYITPVFRFVAAFLVFWMINKEIGYNARLQSTPVLLGLSLVSAVLPSAVMVLLAGVMVLLHIYSASQMLTLVFLLIVLILYFLFARFVPRYGWVVLAIPVLYGLHIPYVVPLVLGLVATPVTALAAGCGVVVHFLLQLVKETALLATGNMDMEGSLAMYTYVLKSLISNRQMMLTIAVFALVIFLVWFVRKLRIAHAHEIALITGTVASILLFLLGDMVLSIEKSGILGMLLGTLVSGVLAYVVQFFRFVLDYSVVENVQFDDDDYYYYVKAVPKLKVTTPEVNVKTFTASREERNARPEPEAEYPAEYEDEDEDLNFSQEEEGYLRREGSERPGRR